MIIHEYVIHNMYMYAMASIRLAKIPWVGWVSKFDLYLYICYRQPCTLLTEPLHHSKINLKIVLKPVDEIPFNKLAPWFGNTIEHHSTKPVDEIVQRKKYRYPPAEKKHPAWNVDYAIDTKHHDPSELGSNWIFTSPEVYSQTGKPKCRFGSNIYPFQGKFFGNGLFYITLLFQRDKNYTLKDILPSDPLVI